MADDDQNVAVDDIAGDDGFEEEKYCMIYDKEDFFTVLVQIMLAIFALLSLYWKRMHEVPKRTFRTWFLDIGKQAVGACYAHVLNMIIAAVIATNPRGEVELKDQCAWYGMSYLIDTTLGLVLAIILVRLLDKTANARNWIHLKHSGVYTDDDGILHWVSQCIAWIAILTIVKIIIYAFMVGCSEWLAWVGGVLFAPLQSNIRFELLFVMIFFPGFLNVIYFWIADGYLKANKNHASAHEPVDSKAEALVSSEQELPESSADYKPAPWSAVGGQQTSAPSTAV